MQQQQTLRLDAGARQPQPTQHQRTLAIAQGVGAEVAAEATEGEAVVEAAAEEVLVGFCSRNAMACWFLIRSLIRIGGCPATDARCLCCCTVPARYAFYW